MYSIIKRDEKKIRVLLYLWLFLLAFILIYCIGNSVSINKALPMIVGLVFPDYGWQYSLLLCFNIIVLLMCIEIIYGDLEKSREFIFLRISKRKWFQSKIISLLYQDILFHFILCGFLFVIEFFFYNKIDFLFTFYLCSISLLYHLMIQMIGIFLYKLPYKIGLVCTLSISILPFIGLFKMSVPVIVILVVLFILLGILSCFWLNKILKIDWRNIK